MAMMMTHYRVNCEARKYATDSAAGYDPAGNMLFTVRNPTPMSDAIPDSVADVMVETLCEVRTLFDRDQKAALSGKSTP
ncbi:hypothetical protein PQR16_14860 [Caballeronia glebae]